MSLFLVYYHRYVSSVCLSRYIYCCCKCVFLYMCLGIHIHVYMLLPTVLIWTSHARDRFTFWLSWFTNVFRELLVNVLPLSFPKICGLHYLQGDYVPTLLRRALAVPHNTKRRWAPAGRGCVRGLCESSCSGAVCSVAQSGTDPVPQRGGFGHSFVQELVAWGVRLNASFRVQHRQFLLRGGGRGSHGAACKGCSVTLVPWLHSSSGSCQLPACVSLLWQGDATHLFAYSFLCAW